MLRVRVIPQSYVAHFGFDHGALNQAAMGHHAKMNFKAAFSRAFDEHFDDLTSISLPMVRHPELAPSFDKAGHAHPDSVRVFHEKVLNLHAKPSVGEISLADDLFPICVRSPDGGWIIINGYPMKLNGEPWLSDEAVNIYMNAIGADAVDADSQAQLRKLQVMMYTQYTLQQLFIDDDIATASSDPVAGAARA